LEQKKEQTANKTKKEQKIHLLFYKKGQEDLLCEFLISIEGEKTVSEDNVSRTEDLVLERFRKNNYVVLSCFISPHQDLHLFQRNEIILFELDTAIL
jgi:hypothetical protein